MACQLCTMTKVGEKLYKLWRLQTASFQNDYWATRVVCDKLFVYLTVSSIAAMDSVILWFVLIDVDNNFKILRFPHNSLVAQPHI